jgi:hypothetical protein
MTDKLQEYKERHKQWTEVSLEQLSTTNNLLLTISSGLLAFCFDKDLFKQIHIDTSQSIKWTQFFYVASIATLACSIALGIGVLFSRLYDFKISRHIAQTRKRVYAKHNQMLPANDLDTPTTGDRIKAMFRIVFSQLPFINKSDVDSYQSGGQLTNNFNDLRRLSNILGSASWRWTKLQTLLFFASVVFYVLHFFC